MAPTASAAEAPARPAAARAGTFAVPNPYLLTTLATALQAGSVFTARCDVIDLQGALLWPRGEPASLALLQGLAQRTLAVPLECCLRAQGGITQTHLVEDLRSFLGSGHALAAAVRPWQPVLEHELLRLPLHAVVQLLLGAARVANEPLYRHAVSGMALAGALAAGRGSARYALRLALLGGLLHDMGELYLHPQYLDPQRELDLFAFRQLAAHPRIGSLLLSELTDYPRALALAIDEHHERLDGGGYPVRRSGDRVSELGRLLAVTEVVLGIVAAARDVPLVRAGFALAFVAEQFDQRWTGALHAAAFASEPYEPPLADAAALEPRRQAVARALDDALREAALLAEQAPQPALQQIGRTMVQRVAQLRRAFSIALAAEVGTHPAAGDHEMVLREMGHRLRGLQRDLTLMVAEFVGPDDAAATQALSAAFSVR